MKKNGAEKVFGMKTLDLIAIEAIPRDLILKIPYSFARKNLLIPIAEDESKVTVAISDPLNIYGLDELQLMLDKKISPVIALEEKILSAINECYHHQEGSTSKLLQKLENGAKIKKESFEEDSYDLLEAKEEDPIVHLLNLILSEAIAQRASDIHFEPFEEDLKVRYRIDGVLQGRHNPPREYQSQLLTRIKVLAKLDIAEHRLPQDGRIKLRMGGREIDFRVSTVPVSYGERIVLRILDKENITLGLDQIGMLPNVLEEFRKLTFLSEGIVLVTGPTGSGKTTTLYSALKERNDDEINIMTIEDPVEYKLKGIAQIAVHPKIGLNFAKGLRHILRQDPDVVMIGEIRDTETAEIAIQSALTGHLVLSTLHTNDAPSALTRLIDMGIEPYLLSSTIVGVLAQRLLRKNCSHCVEKYIPSDEELEEIDLSREFLVDNSLFKGRGCSNCFGSGYLGRTGVYELMPLSFGLQTLVAKHADARELRELAIREGMTTLREHSIHLVKMGLTTISEVLRVTRKHSLEE